MVCQAFSQRLDARTMPFLRLMYARSSTTTMAMTTMRATIGSSKPSRSGDSPGFSKAEEEGFEPSRR